MFHGLFGCIVFPPVRETVGSRIQNPHDEGLVSKFVNSAFIGTDLDLRLRRLGVDTAVVFGITTDMCVSTTIRVGANLGYRMVMAHEACDCFDVPDANGVVIPARESHRAHVATLGFEFATLASQDDLVRWVRKT